MTAAPVYEVASGGWSPQTSPVPMLTDNGPVQLLARQPNRRSVVIINQTFVMTGTTGILLLFANEEDAKATQARGAAGLLNGFRGIPVGDGSAYTAAHQAAVWALCVGSGLLGIAAMSPALDG